MGARGGRLLPGCGASRVGRSPTPDQSSFRACVRGPLPTGCGCGGCGRRNPSPTPQRALLGACFARCGVGTRAPGGGASCLGVGQPGTGALPPRTSRFFGCGAGARFPLAVGSGGCGRGNPSPTPQRALLRASLARCGGGTRAPGEGRLLPGCGASGDGRSPGPYLSSFRACGRGPLPTGRGCGVRAWGPGCPWHLLPCRGSSCVVRASRVCGTRWSLWLGTYPHAVVVAGGVPLWRASWPRVGVPRLVRSGRSRCPGRLSRRRGAFTHPARQPPALLGGCAGHVEPAENQALCACHWPLPRQGRWVSSVPYPFGAPRWGCPWRVPPASVFGCVGLACVDPTGDSAGAPGLFRVDTDTCPFGSEDARPGSCARVCACSSWLAGAGRPLGRVLVRLTFSCGRVVLLLCSAPTRLGLPALWVFLFLPSFLLSPLWHPRCLRLFVLPGPECPEPWPSFFFCCVLPPCPVSFLFFPDVFPLLDPPRGPLCSCFCCPWPWRSVVPPPFFFVVVFYPVVFSLFCAPSSRLGVSVLPGPWCPGVWRSVSRRSLLFLFFFVFPLLFCPHAFLGSGRSWCSWPLACLAGVLFPSPCAAVPVVRALCAGAAVRVVPYWCCPVASFALAGALCCCLWLRGGRCWVWFSAGVLWRGWSCLAAWRATLLCALGRPGVPLPCAVSCVLLLCVAAWWRAVVPCCPFCFVLWSMWRCVAPWRCLWCVVLVFGWCSVSPLCAPGCSLLGLVACLPCCFVRAGWCCVLLRVGAGSSLLGLVACCCFPLVCIVSAAPVWQRGLLPCTVPWFVVVPCSPAPCPVFCGAVLPCSAVVWRAAVRLRLLVVLVCVLSWCVPCRVALRVVLFGAALVCAVVGTLRCGVLLCVVVPPLAFCGVVVLLWCVVASCCAVLCSVVLCRLVVPCCWAVLCVLLCCGCFFFL